MFLSTSSCHRPAGRIVACLLCFPLFAQPPAAKANRVDLGAISGKLQIFVLKGRDEVHLTSDQSQKFVVVEVRDDNNLPVEGADVIFELPATGPGGLFRDDQSRTTTRTTGQGQAAAAFNPSRQPGKFQIAVQASIGTRTGAITVPQLIATRSENETSARKGGFFNKKNIIILSLIGAGAATGIVLATRGSSAPIPIPPITINPGGPTFGGPR